MVDVLNRVRGPFNVNAAAQAAGIAAVEDKKVAKTSEEAFQEWLRSDGKKQFEAIWHYLEQLNDAEMPK